VTGYNPGNLEKYNTIAKHMPGEWEMTNQCVKTHAQQFEKASLKSKDAFPAI